MNNQTGYRKELYDKFISTHFGKFHKDTPKEMEIYSRYFRKNYLRFLPKNKNAKILDVGCGMGHFLYFLQKEEYRNYIGIDISEENIEVCKKRNFKVEKADVFIFLKNHKEPFDLIVMNDIIEHFKKEEILPLLRLVREHLIAGGKIIIKTGNCSNPLMGVSSRYLDFTHEIGFTEGSLSQVLEICDFKEVKIYPQDIFIFYLNPINYPAKFIHGLLSVIFRLFFLLYGRMSTRIFSKSMIGVGTKA